MTYIIYWLIFLFVLFVFGFLILPFFGVPLKMISGMMWEALKGILGSLFEFFSGFLIAAIILAAIIYYFFFS